MIAQLAEMAYRKAGQMFFCVQKDARSVTFSYRRARFAAAALAQQLAKRGYGRPFGVARRQSANVGPHP